MSTKIYNGCKLDLSLLTLLELPGVLRGLLDPVAESELLRMVVADAAFKFDALSYPPARGTLETDERCSVLVSASMGITRDVWEANNSPHRSQYDMSFDVTVIPVSGSTSEALAITFTERAAYTAAWMALEGVSEYGYWNNTDRPIGISDEEWSERGEAWSDAMPGFEAPSRRGLTWSLLDSSGTPSFNVFHVKVEDVTRHIPSKASRARRLSQTLAAARLKPSIGGDVVGITRALSEGALDAHDEAEAVLPPMTADLLMIPVNELVWA